MVAAKKLIFCNGEIMLLHPFKAGQWKFILIFSLCIPLMLYSNKSEREINQFARSVSYKHDIFVNPTVTHRITFYYNFIFFTNCYLLCDQMWKARHTKCIINITK